MQGRTCRFRDRRDGREGFLLPPFSHRFDFTQQFSRETVSTDRSPGCCRDAVLGHAFTDVRIRQTKDKSSFQDSLWKERGYKKEPPSVSACVVTPLRLFFFSFPAAIQVRSRSTIRQRFLNRLFSAIAIFPSKQAISLACHHGWHDPRLRW
jgi:hypothetical protein